jgi:hypothetical protein
MRLLFASKIQTKENMKNLAFGHILTHFLIAFNLEEERGIRFFLHLLQHLC